MPDHNDFVALRELLEAEARQPAFGVIRSLRRQRTRGLAAVASVVISVLVLAIGTAVALGGVGRSPLPPSVPQPNPLVPTSTDSAGGQSFTYYPSNVDSLVRAPSGSVYALANSCQPVDQQCDRQSARRRLLVSDDLAAGWTTVGNAPLGGQLLMASDARLWIVGSTLVATLRAVNGVMPTTVPDVVTAAGSADGGRTWQTWTLDDETFGSVGGHTADTAGGTTWITHGARVYTASGVTRPTPTASQPPGIDNIYKITAISSDHAIVMGVPNYFAPAVWFETTDRGAHWRQITDPCAGTPQAGSVYSTFKVAQDGSWWVGCVSAPSGVMDPGSAGPTFVNTSPGPHIWPRQVLVSIDAGRTWQNRGALTDPVNDASLTLYPVSATTAWRADLGGDVMRTINGTSWSSVARTGGGLSVSSFVAVDGLTAAYIAESGNATVPVITVTRDGGRTWITHPLPTVT